MITSLRFKSEFLEIYKIVRDFFNYEKLIGVGEFVVSANFKGKIVHGQFSYKYGLDYLYVQTRAHVCVPVRNVVR